MTVNGADISIKDVMRTPQTITEDVSFHDAMERMIQEKTNSLVVVNGEGAVVGMINPKSLIKMVVPDYLEGDAIAAHFVSEEIFREEAMRVADTKVRDFMQKDIVTVEEGDSLMQAAVVAASSGLVRIPVVDAEGKPVGLITRTELKNVIGVFLGIDGCFSG